MGLITSYVVTTGTSQVTNATPDATLIAAQGTSKTIYVMRVFISILVAAAGGGGQVALENGVGGTRFVEVSGDSVLAGTFSIDFGDNGYPLTANTLLNATTDNALTTQATARVTVIARVV